MGMFRSSDMRAYQPKFAPPVVKESLTTAIEVEPAKIVLPYPPSVNRIWRMVMIGKTPRMLLSKEGREYHDAARAIVQASGQRIANGAVVVHIWLYRPQKSGDIDNFLKAVLDSVTGAGWTDDSQVVEIHAYRLESPNNPRVELLFERVKGDAPLFEGANQP